MRYRIHTENELISVLLVVKSLVNGTALGNTWSVKTENSGEIRAFFPEFMRNMMENLLRSWLCSLNPYPWFYGGTRWRSLERPVKHFRDYKIFDRRLENSGIHVWLLLVLSLIILAGREGQDWWTAGFIYDLS